MRRTIWASAGLLPIIITISVIQAGREEAAAAQGQKLGAGVPTFDVDPYWPKPLPIDWTFGEFSGVAVDSEVYEDREVHPADRPYGEERGWQRYRESWSADEDAVVTENERVVRF